MLSTVLALYKKELRGLLPLLVVVTFFFASDFLVRPFVERLDEVSWVDQSGQLDPSPENVDLPIFYLIFGLIAAYSLFPREHDEKTIELLYALPISRGGIFAAKVLAAWTVLLVGVVLEVFAGGVFQALNPQSWSGQQWRWGLALRITLLDAFFCAVILAHGLLISFLRRLGLLVYAIAALVVTIAKKHVPSAAVLDPLELLSLEYRGSELVVPWTSIALHGAVAFAALAMAYLSWLAHAEPFVRLYERITSRLAGRTALGCVSLAIGGVLIAWIVNVASQAEIGEGPAVSYREYLPARAETLHYDFTYATNQTSRARPLLREADRVYDEVAAFLGDESGFRIDADLTDPGAGHLGIAQGGVIRLALETLDEGEALYTLYHETAHAFQAQLGGRRVAEHMEFLRFFVEGSAEYVARELLSDPEARGAHRRLAAVAWELHALRFRDLIDDRELRGVYDASLVYPLGETWAWALAETCGDAVVGGFFRALGRPDPPEDLDGIALWQDTLRSAGCSLEAAVARWGETMRRLVEKERPFIDALPRLGGGVVTSEDGELVFSVELDRGVEVPAETYYLRVRRDASAPEDQTYTFTAQLADDGSGATFRVPEDRLETSAFECQFGQSIPGSLWPFFEEWQTVSFDEP